MGFSWECPQSGIWSHRSQDFTARAKGKGEKLEIRDAPDGNSQMLSQRGIFSLNYGKSPPIPHFAREKEGKVAIPKQEFLNSQIFTSILRRIPEYIPTKRVPTAQPLPGFPRESECCRQRRLLEQLPTFPWNLQAGISFIPLISAPFPFLFFRLNIFGEFSLKEKSDPEPGGAEGRNSRFPWFWCFQPRENPQKTGIFPQSKFLREHSRCFQWE